MRVLIINTSERTGGAAVAASRLLESLKNNGIKAKMLVRDKQTERISVVSLKSSWLQAWKFVWERMVIWSANRFRRNHLFDVDIANTGTDITSLPEFHQADVIHLHWINQGMLSLKDLRKIFLSGKPVVWTMHDMWPCTGICHYAYECTKYKQECHHCPFLYKGGSSKDLSYRTFRKKEELFKEAEIQIVTVSHWLAGEVRQSTLLKDKPITVIPNTLSLSAFKMLDKEECRKKLSLPGKHLILFGAARLDAPIKGIHILLEAIRHLITRHQFAPEELHLVLFGAAKHPEQLFPQIPVTYSNLGLVKDSSILSQLYSAADVTVSASLYETFGQTLIEAQACGCLPVSFGNSGQADIIRHKENGYLADYLSAESLAEGIRWALTQGAAEISRDSLRANVAKKYSGEVVAKQYIQLYQKMMEKHQ